MNEKATWLRPKTIRRYLHPIASERLFSLWCEGKIVFGEVNVKDFKLGSGYKEGRQYYFDLESCIVWLLYSKAAEQFDFKNVKNIITEDGTPVHGLSYEIDNQIISIEALCNTLRKSTCFAKISLKNTTNQKVKDTVALLLRSGKECELVYGTPNGYVRHEPDVKVQKKMPSTFRKLNDTSVNLDDAGEYDDENSVIGDSTALNNQVEIERNTTYSDGTRYLNVKCDVNNHFDAKTGILYFDYELDANEEKNIYFSIDMGEIQDFDYEEEKQKNHEYWLNELKSLNKLPVELENDPKTYKMLRHMVTVLLQTFAYPIGEDYMISRQGGMMSICWPSEALFTIEALSKIGDFGKYLNPVFDTHFFVMQKESGEIGNVGAHWGSVTASVIFSFCKYAQSANKEIYDRYIKQVLAAYRWMIKVRKEVVDTNLLAGGLFPSQNSNDWEAPMQGWTLTDVFNIFAIKELIKTTKQYGDEKLSEEIKVEHDAYVKDMKRHFKKFYDAYEGKDELKIPLMPMGDDQQLIDDGFPLIYHGRFILSGVIEDEKDIRRVYNYMINHGICKDGLYGYMPYPNGNRHIWYMSFPDYYWHIIWTKLNEKQLARQIIDNQINYAMTDEYYMLERYEDNSPYYVPWSPNASATGRLIMMMLGELNGYKGEYE